MKQLTIQPNHPGWVKHKRVPYNTLGQPKPKLFQPGGHCASHNAVLSTCQAGTGHVPQLPTTCCKHLAAIAGNLILRRSKLSSWCLTCHRLAFFAALGRLMFCFLHTSQCIDVLVSKAHTASHVPQQQTLARNRLFTGNTFWGTYEHNADSCAAGEHQLAVPP